jgi:hypothetical protein
LSERLARLGIETVADVLCFLPLRYEDRTQVRRLGSLEPGEKALVEGRVELAEVAFRRRRSLLCRLADGTGAVTLRFFHFSTQQQNSLVRGAQLRCFGEVRAGPTGLEMIHPEYRIVGAADEAETNALTPVYPRPKGCSNSGCGVWSRKRSRRSPRNRSSTISRIAYGRVARDQRGDSAAARATARQRSGGARTAAAPMATTRRARGARCASLEPARARQRCP